MQKYFDLIKDVMDNGVDVETEKGPTRSLLGAKVTYDIEGKLPAITARKMNLSWAIAEMLMFIKGVSHTDFLKPYGAEKIWEKQGLSEDFVIQSKKNPMDVLNELLLIDPVRFPTMETAREFITSETMKYKEKMDKLVAEFQQVIPKDEAPEETDKRFQEQTLALNTDFEKIFEELGVQLKIDEVVKTKGDLGPIYGSQWRGWMGVNPLDRSLMKLDQLKEVVWKLNNIPASRQNMLIAWNPSDIARERHSYDEKIKRNFMGQPPCHFASQFISRKVDGSDKRELHAIVYIRSNDLVLGHGFNAIGYGLLTHLLASETNQVAKSVTFLIGDAHIYANQMEKLGELLSRDPDLYPQPTFNLPEGTTIENVTYETIMDSIGPYESYPHIAFELSV